MKHDVAKGKTFQEHIDYLTEKTGFRAQHMIGLFIGFIIGYVVRTIKFYFDKN